MNLMIKNDEKINHVNMMLRYKMSNFVEIGTSGSCGKENSREN